MTTRLLQKCGVVCSESRSDEASDYEVIETPITGLGKLVALSTLAWGTEKNRRDERREQQLMLREGEVTSENVCEIEPDINVEPKSFLISTHNLDVAKGEPEGRPHNVEWRKETPPHWPPVKMQQKLFVDEEGFDTYNRGVHSMLRYHLGSLQVTRGRSLMMRS